jgi:AAHS family benzoate transporter-like MFS transporter
VFWLGALPVSAQTLLYARVGQHYLAENRATALGWVAGLGRFGAVFGPWIGGMLIAWHAAGWGFPVFAAAGLLGAAMVGLARRRPSPTDQASAPATA